VQLREVLTGKPTETKFAYLHWPGCWKQHTSFPLHRSGLNRVCNGDGRSWGSNHNEQPLQNSIQIPSA